MDKIMVAVDGSETSWKAAQLGIEIARRSQGSIIAVYVVDVIRLAKLPGYAVLPGSKDKLLNLMKKEGKEATIKVEKRANLAGIKSYRMLEEGDPADVLIRVSKEINPDLLVMGSVGRTGLDRFIVGSVAEKVVHHASVPVMLFPGDRSRQ